MYSTMYSNLIWVLCTRLCTAMSRKSLKIKFPGYCFEKVTLLQTEKSGIFAYCKYRKIITLSDDTMTFANQIWQKYSLQMWWLVFYASVLHFLLNSLFSQTYFFKLKKYWIFNRTYFNIILINLNIWIL